MINRWQQRLLAILLIVLTLTCGGCWGRRELDTLAIVSGLAFDVDPADGKKIYVTTQILKINQSNGGNKGGSEEQKGYINVTASGYTVHEALRNCTHKLSRRLFFPQNRVILFGEDLARKGIKDYLDFFFRDHESRNTVWVAVTKGKAADILQASELVETTPTLDIARLIITRRATSFASGVNMHELGKRYSSKSAAPLASYLEVKKEDQKSVLYLTGTAVFNRNLEMVGTLTKRETRGLLWAINEAYGGVAVVKNPQDDLYTSMEILRSSSTVTPEIKDGKLQLQVKVKCISNVSESMGSLDMVSPEVWQSLRRREATVIHNDIVMAVEKSRQLNVDLFGFGDRVYQKYPQAWKQMENNWQQTFNTMDIKVNVNTELQRSGKINRSIIK